MIDFPSNPANGYIHSEQGQSWQWHSPPDCWAVASGGSLIGAGAGYIDPKDFGAPTDGVSPASAGIQAAIDAIINKSVNGSLWINRPYALDRPLTVYGRSAIHILGDASFDRRAFPNEFNGNRLYPHASMTEKELLKVGEFSKQDTNPQGIMIEGVNFDGRDINGDHVLNQVGLYVRDTSDVYLRRNYFGGFDRTDNTGFGVIVEGTAEGNCFGTISDNCIYSNSQHGIFYTGLGTTDMRHSNNLYVGVTRAMTLGYDDRNPDNVRQQGGAGMQTTNDHFTYTGMPTAGWFIRNGGQGGSLMVTNNYFDQHGTAYPIRLGNAKVKLTNSHFLMAAAQNSQGLIRVQTSGSQQTIVSHNTVDLVGSELQSLVHYTAITSEPTGGVITANEVYGVSGNDAWKGHAMLGDGTVIDNIEKANLVIKHNVRTI